MVRYCVRAVTAAASAWLIVATSTGPARAFDQPPAGGEALPSFGEPGISPDGSEIAFVSGGDIWTVSSGGGEARLLVSHPATESRPLYSPDGELPRLRVHAHRQRRHLRPRAQDRGVAPPDVRRRA